MRRKLLTIAFTSLFSFALWGSVSLSDEYYATFHIPVRVIDQGGRYSISGYSNEEVTILLKGVGWQLAGLSLGPQQFFDLVPGSEAGKKKINVRKQFEQTSWITSNLQLKEVQPEAVEYIVEKMSEKRVDIVADIDLQFRPGYGRVTPITVIPDSVLVTGPESILASLDFITTESSVVGDIYRPVSARIGLDVPEHTKIQNNDVLITFDVQKIVDKEFSDIKVETRNVPVLRELELYPTQVRIVLRGGINTLGRMTGSELNPYVTFSQALNDTTGLLHPVLEVPEYITLLEIKPNGLEYIIKKF